MYLGNRLLFMCISVSVSKQMYSVKLHLRGSAMDEGNFIYLWCFLLNLKPNQILVSTQWIIRTNIFGHCFTLVFKILVFEHMKKYKYQQRGKCKRE